MNSTYALIEKGVVVNTIMWDGNTNLHDGGWQPPDGATVVEIPYGTVVAIGYLYSNETFSAPAQSHT